MGICWSEPPPPPVVNQPVPYRKCLNCGRMNRDEYCQSCLQRNAMSYIAPNQNVKPSAPPMYPAQQQYTYAQPQQIYTQPQQQYTYAQAYTYANVYPQQQMYYQQQQMNRQSNMGNIATAAIGGYVLGSVLDDMMDPN